MQHNYEVLSYVFPGAPTSYITETAQVVRMMQQITLYQVMIMETISQKSMDKILPLASRTHANINTIPQVSVCILLKKHLIDNANVTIQKQINSVGNMNIKKLIVNGRLTENYFTCSGHLKGRGKMNICNRLAELVHHINPKNLSNSKKKLHEALEREKRTALEIWLQDGSLNNVKRF